MNFFKTFASVVFFSALTQAVDTSDNEAIAFLTIPVTNSTFSFKQVSGTMIVPVLNEGPGDGPWQARFAIGGATNSDGSYDAGNYWVTLAGVSAELNVNGSVDVAFFYYNTYTNSGFATVDEVEVSVGDEVRVTITRNDLAKGNLGGGIGTILFENLSNGGEQNVSITADYGTGNTATFTWGVSDSTLSLPNFGILTWTNCSAAVGSINPLLRDSSDTTGDLLNAGLVYQTFDDASDSSVDVTVSVLDSTSVQVEYLTS